MFNRSYNRINFKLKTILYMLFLPAVFLVLTSCSIIPGIGQFNPEGNWELEKTKHFDIYYRADSYAEENLDDIVLVQEETYQYILEQLNVQFDETISIYIYPTPEDAGWDHVQGLAYNRQKVVLGVYSEKGKSIGVEGASAHEITHVITWNAIGKPGTTFLNEGLAVTMDGVWHAVSDPITDLHQWTKKFMDEDKLPAISEMVSSWNSLDTLITYPVSGSFVSYLVDKYGMEKFKKMLVEANRLNFNSKCQEIYNKELSTLELEWKVYVMEITA